jgi:hypothetical protein
MTKLKTLERDIAAIPTTSKQLYDCSDRLVAQVDEYKVGIQLVLALSFIVDPSLLGLAFLFIRFCVFASQANSSSRWPLTKKPKSEFWVLVLKFAYDYVIAT